MEYIKEYIENLYNTKVQNTSPEMATDLANSLDLLSSGIYTEEERFIFELFQNAVDSSSEDANLSIRIKAVDDFLVFMHNGKPFSKRDIEGICSVGNGSKASDTRKIGYKGIGFKSVFMHSQEVYIKTDGVVFRFDKKHWENYFGDDCVSKSGRMYKMPWQIIPILSEKLPINVNATGYNVCTYIRSANVKSLIKKVHKLLNDSQFLLFLRNNNIHISLYQEGKCIRVLKKVTINNESIGENKEQAKVILSVDGKVSSRWLVYKNDSEKLTQEQMQLIKIDSRTPQKLQDASSFDISFAICLDEKGTFQPVSESVLYTYLPTSYQFGFPFLVNANFITDAGRQHLNDDAEWNKIVISSIPKLYLEWMAKLSVSNRLYYKVLPPVKVSKKSLGDEYNGAMCEALSEIAFIPNKIREKLLKVSEVLIDDIGLSDAISSKKFDKIVSCLLGITNASSKLVSNDAKKALSQYGIKEFTKTDLFHLIEKAENYFSNFNERALSKFLMFLKGLYSSFDNEAKQMLSYSKILLDENGKLECPQKLFFPSKFRDEEDAVRDAKFLSPKLLKLLPNCVEWLKDLGVAEMSALSVIKNVFCIDGGINKDNAIEAMQFIFDADKNEKVLDKLYRGKIQKLSVLSSKGELYSPSTLFLTINYGTNVKADFECTLDVFISSDYIRNGDDPLEWALFFKRIGVNDKIQICNLTLNDNTYIYNKVLSYYITKVKREEYNTWSYDTRKFPVQNIPFVSVMFCPLVSFQKTDFRLNRMAWNAILKEKIFLGKNDDYIYANTGMGYHIDCLLTRYNYLGENFLPWVIKSYALLPTTTGELGKVQDILENTEYNIKLCGHYFPVLDIDSHIHESWREYLPFKKNVSLTECLSILESVLDDGDSLKENMERIGLLYQELSNFDIQEGSSDWNKVAEWGKTHKILSIERKFKFPSQLVLVSANLGKLDIQNQVYCGKQVETKSNRFVHFMCALGVRFINNFVSEFVGKIPDDSYKKVLVKKCDLIALISAGREATRSEYDDRLVKIKEEIENEISFEKNERITLSYGREKVEKKTYVDTEHSCFHYVGESLTPAILDLMLAEMAKMLSIPPNDRSTLATAIQIRNIAEARDYLKEKGFNVALLPEMPIPISQDQDIPTLGGTDNPITGLSAEQMRDALTEAKDAALSTLKSSGFDITHADWDGWTSINGVTKDGQECPIVIRSNKSGISTRLNASDWMQLMKPNSMLVVNTSTGIGTIPLRNILKSKENITIRFSTSNIDSLQHITDIAQVLYYFKELQIDFNSFKPVLIGQWERFMAPENNIGELPRSSSIELPE